jgi:hypothetical protein
MRKHLNRSELRSRVFNYLKKLKKYGSVRVKQFGFVRYMKDQIKNLDLGKGLLRNRGKDFRDEEEERERVNCKVIRVQFYLNEIISSNYDRLSQGWVLTAEGRDIWWQGGLKSEVVYRGNPDGEWRKSCRGELVKLDKDALARTRKRRESMGKGELKIVLSELKVEYLKYDFLTVTTFLEKLGNSVCLRQVEREGEKRLQYEMKLRRIEEFI